MSNYILSPQKIETGFEFSTKEKFSEVLPFDIDCIRDSGFVIYTEKNGEPDKLAAIVGMFFFDEANIISKYTNMEDVYEIEDDDIFDSIPKVIHKGLCDGILDIAHEMDKVPYEAMSLLVKNNIFNKTLDEDSEMREKYDCYVSNFYVFDEFRGKGLEEYIISNMEDILKIIASKIVRTIVISPFNYFSYDEETESITKLSIPTL